MDNDTTPIVHFFTDFGAGGPYLGLMETALLAQCPSARVVNLAADAPAFSPRHAGYLLAAMVPWMARSALVVAVVDPGVGGPRRPLLVQAGARRFIGPDNGLLAPLCHGEGPVQAWAIGTSGFQLSASFHGRDLFAPAAGRLLSGRPLELEPLPLESLTGYQWPEELPEVIYLDQYGNAMTGLRPPTGPEEQPLRVGDRLIARAGTFSEVARGEPFWYVNSLGLVEVAVNQGRADHLLRLAVGSPVSWG